MIRTIQLKFGSAPHQEPVHLDVAPVTVFVGPNNAGKSEILQEINQYCANGVSHQSDVILESILYLDIPTADIPTIRQRLTQQPHKNETINPGKIIIGRHHHRIQVNENLFDSALRDPNNQSQHFSQWFIALHTLMLDGKSRIALVNEQDASDLQQLPQNFLDILFRDDDKRSEVRRIALDAFGDYFVVDPTNLGKLRIRYSRTAPPDHQTDVMRIDSRPGDHLDAAFE